MKKTRMKSIFAILAAAAVSGALSSTTMAQNLPAPNGNITPTEITRFNHYLDKHPQVAQGPEATGRISRHYRAAGRCRMP